MLEDITAEEIMRSVMRSPRHTGKVKYAPVPIVHEPRNVESEIRYIKMMAENAAKQKQQKSKPKKSGRISSKDIPDSLPSNIKQFTLPDGSVVCVNTDETELTVESVIDSITGTK